MIQYLVKIARNSRKIMSAKIMIGGQNFDFIKIWDLKVKTMTFKWLACLAAQKYLDPIAAYNFGKNKHLTKAKYAPLSHLRLIKEKKYDI